VQVESVEEPYAILNVTRVVDCIDEERTLGYKYSTDDHARPDLAGQWKSFLEPRLDSSRIGPARIFRLQGHIESLVVDQDVKALIESADAVGLYFKPLFDEEPGQAPRPTMMWPWFAGGRPSTPTASGSSALRPPSWVRSCPAATR